MGEKAPRMTYLRPGETLRKKQTKPRVKMTYEDYLKSEAWRVIRKKVLNRDGNRCRLCNRRNVAGRALHVHHRVYNTARGEENPKDLLTLCSECHALFHKRRKLPGLMTSRERKEEKKENRRRAKKANKKKFRGPTVKEDKKRIKQLRENRAKKEKERMRCADQDLVLDKEYAEILDQ